LLKTFLFSIFVICVSFHLFPSVYKNMCLQTILIVA
jgi:hypothetical protein